MPKVDNSPPRGTRDFLPDEVVARESLTTSLVRTYERFGFRRIETPALESINRLRASDAGDNEKLIYKVLRRGLDPLIVNAAVDDLVDLGLRFDLTVPLARFYANNRGRLPDPFRAMQVGPVWRAERPQKGRFRQFVQCDIDTLGENSQMAEAELLEATMTALFEAGIDGIEARVNDRRLLSAIAATAGVDAADTSRFLVTLDKLDKIGWEGVLSELAGRGFAASVGNRARQVISALSEAAGSSELLDRAADLLSPVVDGTLTGLAGTAAAVETLCASGTIGRASFRLDPTIVRGQGYYSGQIFELFHTEVQGSVAAGGRYDGLVGRSLETSVPACGISIGFERVVELVAPRPADLGVALVYPRDGEIAPVLSAARSLRLNGARVTLVLARSNEGRQMQSLARDGFRSAYVLRGGSLSSERRLEAP